MQDTNGPTSFSSSLDVPDYSLKHNGITYALAFAVMYEQVSDNYAESMIGNGRIGSSWHNRSKHGALRRFP